MPLRYKNDNRTADTITIGKLGDTTLPYVLAERADKEGSVSAKLKESIETLSGERKKNKDALTGISNILKGISNISMAYSLGSAFAGPLAFTSYPASVVSSLTGMAAAGIDPNLTTGERAAIMSAESVGLIPGSTYVKAAKGLQKVTKAAGKVIKADKLEKAKKLEKALDKRFDKAEKANNDAYEALLEAKQTGDAAKIAEAEKKYLDANDKFSNIVNSGSESLLNRIKIPTPTMHWLATGLTNFGIAGGLEYGVPAIIEASLNGEHESSLSAGAVNGVINLYNDLAPAGRALVSPEASLDDRLALGRVGALLSGTLLGGKANGRKYGLYNMGSKATKVGMYAAVPTALATGTLGKLDSNRILNDPDRIYINPDLGTAGPYLLRKEGMSDQYWNNIAKIREDRPQSGGVYVYDKNNNKYILTAKDPKTYILKTPDGQTVIGEFPVTDIKENEHGKYNAGKANYLFATKNGWSGTTTSELFEAMPYVREKDGKLVFEKKGGKLNTLKNLRYENNT